MEDSSNKIIARLKLVYELGEASRLLAGSPIEGTCLSQVVRQRQFSGVVRVMAVAGHPSSAASVLGKAGILDPLCIGSRESSINNAVFMSRVQRFHLGPGVN